MVVRPRPGEWTQVRILHLPPNPTTNKPNIPMGLIDQIKTADTTAIIDDLLERGKSYTQALPTTKRKWTTAAKRRKEELLAIEPTSKEK